MEIIKHITPGRFVTIDWLRTDDDTQTLCSINGKVMEGLSKHRTANPYVWLAGDGRACVTMRGSKTARTQPRQAGRHKDNPLDKTGQAYWTIPLDKVVAIHTDKHTIRFD